MNEYSYYDPNMEVIFAGFADRAAATAHARAAGLDYPTIYPVFRADTSTRTSSPSRPQSADAAFLALGQ